MAIEKDFRFSVRYGNNQPPAGVLNNYELGFGLEKDINGNVLKSYLYTQMPDEANTRLIDVGDATTLAGFGIDSFARTDINDGGVENSAEVFQYGLKVNGILWATAQRAKYADIAEYYETDIEYTPGDILMVGTDTEAIISDGTMPLMGVCSTAPAYLMNTDIENLVDEKGEKSVLHYAPIALKGRIPVNITGSAKRGDYIVVDIKNPGKGKAVKTYPKTNADKILVGICITGGKKTCEIKV